MVTTLLNFLVIGLTCIGGIFVIVLVYLFLFDRQSLTGEEDTEPPPKYTIGELNDELSNVLIALNNLKSGVLFEKHQMEGEVINIMGMVEKIQQKIGG